MALSCFCDSDDADWYYTVNDDFTAFGGRRATRCCSCRARIAPGDDCVVVERWRHPKNDIEEKIYGEGCEIYMADKHLCEICGGLYWAVSDLGMCCDIEYPIAAQIKDFNRITRS